MKKPKKQKQTLKSNNKSEPSPLDGIASEINAIAKDMGKEPWEITKVQYIKGGGSYSPKQLERMGGFNSIKGAYFSHQSPVDQAAKIDLNEIKKDYARLLKEQGDYERLFRRIESSVSQMPKFSGPVYKPRKPQGNPSRSLNLILSDLHIGSDLSSKETTSQFGRIEEARALAGIVKNVCEYKQQYRDNTELNILLIGDIFEGELHDRTSADLLHIQTCRAIHLLTQVIKRFSENFPTVNIHTSVGNHGRDTAIHKQRATALKINALETTVYFAIKTACSGLSNVKFEQSTHPWTVVKAQGYNFFAAHGDTVFNVGNIGNSVNVKSLENQINKINASLGDTNEYKVFVVGHIHQAMVTQVSNGATVIVNGALTPPNAFANSLGIMESKQIQVLWETVAGFPVGDIRFIDVSDTAKKTDLDKIIVPFNELVL